MRSASTVATADSDLERVKRRLPRERGTVDREAMRGLSRLGTASTSTRYSGRSSDLGRQTNESWYDQKSRNKSIRPARFPDGRKAPGNKLSIQFGVCRSESLVNTKVSPQHFAHWLWNDSIHPDRQLSRAEQSTFLVAGQMFNKWVSSSLLSLHIVRSSSTAPIAFSLPHVGFLVKASVVMLARLRLRVTLVVPRLPMP